MLTEITSFTLQNSKPPKDNFSKNEYKALKELQQFETSIVVLPADEGRATVVLNREDYLKKRMDYINNGRYHWFNKDPTTKIKAKTLKQLKAQKDNESIDQKLYYYLKPADSPPPYFYGQMKIHKPEIHIRPIVSYSDSPLYSPNKYMANILKAYAKDENNIAENSIMLRQKCSHWKWRNNGIIWGHFLVHKHSSSWYVKQNQGLNYHRWLTYLGKGHTSR